ncbi:MAG TPA: RIP metalloprotease RseP [Longimicrobiales bacterium]|nr:RIP metalloprotease RseP [Longimicrobiales bacterium]
MIAILATIIVLGVLIFVHELGHFVTAKWMDIEVPRFSIGLGPKMMGFTRGETEYVISWLPLGGYVKMAGMEDMESLEGDAHDSAEARGRGRDFDSKSLPARVLVISAGVIMNMLFAWFLFAVIAMAWGMREPLPPVVGDVIEEAVPAEAVALTAIAPGSRVVAVNGQPVGDWNEVQRRMAMARDSITLTFERAAPVTVPVPEGDSAHAALVRSLEPSLPVEPTIGTVAEGSPAEAAGFRTRDRIVMAAGTPVSSWQDFVGAVETRPGERVPVIVERDGERVTLEVVPEPRVLAGDPGVRVGRIGVSARQRPVDAYPRTRLGPLQAVAHGAEQTWSITVLILEYLGGLFTGQASPRDVGGPILIYQFTDQVVQVGFDAFLDFMALFSINLAILNLLPIPILDGGQLLFLAVEGIRGKALSIEQRMRLSQVGLVLVVAIMVWALANDVLRLFGL